MVASGTTDNGKDDTTAKSHSSFVQGKDDTTIKPLSAAERDYGNDDNSLTFLIENTTNMTVLVMERPREQ
jgi:hypothetical protein